MRSPIFLDLGATVGFARPRSGLAAWHGSHRLRPLTKPKALSSEQYTGARGESFMQFLIEQRRACTYDGIVLEVAARNFKSRAAPALLYGLRMIACIAANRWGVQVQELPATAVYKWHDVRAGDKEVMILRVKHLYGVECKTSDEADAIAMAKFWENQRNGRG